MTRRILVTAGPTRERIDPIRFISNYSTGTFGYKIADEARRRGFSVTLISGPTELKAPRGVKFIRVENALDMRRAVEREFPGSDCVIMASAVSDWRPRSAAKDKIKRRAGRYALEMIENPDILGGLGRKKGKKVLVGFALETEELVKNAGRKLKEKNLDFIIANKPSPRSTVFGDNPASISILDRFGGCARYFKRTKRELAKIILDKVSRINI